MCRLVCCLIVGVQCMGHGNHSHTQHKCNMCLLCVGLRALYKSSEAIIISDGKAAATSVQWEFAWTPSIVANTTHPAAINDLRRPISSFFLGLTHHVLEE